MTRSEPVIVSHLERWCADIVGDSGGCCIKEDGNSCAVFKHDILCFCDVKCHDTNGQCCPDIFDVGCYRK